VPVQRRERTGVVVSDRMQKTVLVMVERTIVHPKYKKRVRLRTKYKAHDEQNRCRVGDRVVLVETRPLSRDKRWAVRSIVGRAPVLAERVGIADPTLEQDSA
jgi:small subunit ribosomal protein S17